MPLARRLSVPLLLALVVIGSSLQARPVAFAQTPLALVIEPDAGRQPILDFIGSAQTSLDLAIYELSDRLVLRSLEDAAGRGVRVRVLAEPMPGGHPVNARALSELRQKGAQTEDSAPQFRLTHEKALIVDGASAMIMSLNLTAETFSSSRDMAIVDRDPQDVAEIAAVFQADWDRQPVMPGRSSLVWSPDNARTQIEQLIASATSEIDVYAEELEDRRIVALLDSEASAGVRIRLIMTDTGARDGSRTGRANLQQAGGEVRISQKPYIHAKVIVVDGVVAFTGSENLSSASLDRNRELGLLITDASVVGGLSSTFEQDWGRALPLSP
jgi:cardiolipin synthase